MKILNDETNRALIDFILKIWVWY